MAKKQKQPTLAELLRPYGFNNEQIKIVQRGINIVTSYSKTQKILEKLGKTRSGK